MKSIIFAVTVFVAAHASAAEDTSTLTLTDGVALRLVITGDDASLEIAGTPSQHYRKFSQSLGGANFQLRATSKNAKIPVLSLNSQADGSYICVECSDAPERLSKLPVPR